MDGRKIVAVLALVLLCATTVGASSQQLAFNGSEPGFLKNIGPQEPREDNLYAALIVAIGTGAVFYIGFRTFSPNQRRKS